MARWMYIATALILALVLVPLESAAQWHMVDMVDEWGDVTGDRIAASGSVKPSKPMAFPYHDLEAQIMVKCDLVVIAFTADLNLTGGVFDGDSTVFSVPIRVDGKNASPEELHMLLARDGIALIPLGPSWVILTLSKGSTFAIALRWHQQGSVVFKWS